jgi:GWxTD domain-containing protein
MPARRNQVCHIPSAFRRVVFDASLSEVIGVYSAETFARHQKRGRAVAGLPTLKHVDSMTAAIFGNRLTAGMRFRRDTFVRVAILFFGIFALASVGLVAQAKPKKDKEKLPQYYDQWLNRDVAYIITKQERRTFLQLTSDQARDDFIKRFWAIRNPSPGSPVNTYEDQIYRRIAYANAHFGIGSGEAGWRTARGRAYITLGPPQQIQKYPSAPNLFPMEIWFYSTSNPALPPFFYLLFYQRDNVGDFRFYSPYMDGPDKLVGGNEVVNDPQDALTLIEDSVGSEVAHIAQTLIPGEPLDPNGRISLQSDILLAKIRDLADQPSNLDQLDRNRQLVANVTARLIVNTKNLDVVLFPVRDARGTTRLDYAVRLRSASDLTLTQNPDGDYSYAVEVRVRVLTSDGKLIFTQEKSVSGKFGKRRLDEIKGRPFGYEGSLPLAPGKYHLDFLLTDWTKQVGFHDQRDVTIPTVAANALVIPAILPFSAVTPIDRTKDGVTPFAMAGLRFTPLGTSALFYNPAQSMNIVYQIWAAPADPRVHAGQQLAVDYALGDPAIASRPPLAIKDTVDMGNFSPSGELVNGKKISLTDEQEGNYLLTVSVNYAGTAQAAQASLPLQILADVPTTTPWDVDEPGIDTDESRGILDQQRALCYLAQGQPDPARLWFRLALSKDRGDDVARAHLVQAYFNLQAYSAVVSLLNDVGITDDTDSATVAQIAESLLRTGDESKAFSLLEDKLRSRPDDGTLYLALSDCYQKIGDSHDQATMLQRAKSLLKDRPASN